jgi:hypothetical protein
MALVGPCGTGHEPAMRSEMREAGAYARNVFREGTAARPINDARNGPQPSLCVAGMEGAEVRTAYRV